MSIRTSGSQCDSVLYTTPLLVFCLPVPLITGRGMLKSPAITVHLSVSFFRSVSFCFIHFQTRLFGTYPFRVVCLPVNWPYYHWVLPWYRGGDSGWEGEVLVSSTAVTKHWVGQKFTGVFHNIVQKNLNETFDQLRRVEWVTLLILSLICRVHHVKCQAGRSTSWNQDCQEK